MTTSTLGHGAGESAAVPRAVAWVLRPDDSVCRLPDQADQLSKVSPNRATDAERTSITAVSLNANRPDAIPTAAPARFGVETLADSMTACAFDR
jgi:hypothetical protein